MGCLETVHNLKGCLEIVYNLKCALTEKSLRKIGLVFDPKVIIYGPLKMSLKMYFTLFTHHNHQKL